MKFLASSLLALATITSLLCPFAAAQSQPSEVSPATEVRPAAAGVLTFEELKAQAALRSSYRNQPTTLDASEAPTANLEGFRNIVLPVLNASCVDCHGADLQEGNIRLDDMDPDLFHGDDVNWWLEVLAVLSNGEMPPPDEAELAPEDRQKVVEWLSAELQAASTFRRAEGGHSSFRRMTRYEYNYALQDLLGLPYDFAKDLPPESNSEDGFQNSSEMLHMSSMQFSTYRESARQALLRATVRGQKPQPIYWGVSMKAAAEDAWKKQEEQLEKIRKEHKDDPEKLEERLARQRERFQQRQNNTHYRDLKSGRAARVSWSYGGAKYAWSPADEKPVVPVDFDHVAVIPRRQKLIVELGDRVPDFGPLRVRVRASRCESDDNGIPSLQLEFGWQASNDSDASTRVSKADVAIDAQPGEPRFYQWDIPLGEVYPRNSVRNISKMGDLPSPSEFIKFVNSSVSQGAVQIDYVEVTALGYEQWPPESHTRIFPFSSQATDEESQAREILTRFMSRAWRGRVSESDIDRKLALFGRVRPVCTDFQEAMIEVLATVLSSPRFLYLVRSEPAGNDSHDGVANENANKNSHEVAIAESGDAKSVATARLASDELATRLAMFLWSSIPDDELLKLAAEGKLQDAEVLSGQVRRMLHDSRSQRLSQHFVRQWLGMQLLDYLDVDRKAYPRFDTALKEAMQEEPIAFFQDMLQLDNSVLDFLHADHTLANERLAKHYGVEGVVGNEFRRVTLPLDHDRGGLLTQAGLLAMNSDGKDSHPLKRGIWLLESLLNDPPPPPPPAVPEIDLADPEIAKLTLKQRIEDHRNDPACISCHAKIDPWGIAFENFDAVGSWRSEVQGKTVDAASELFNGQKLNGMGGLKRFLLGNRQDQFVRALVHKMMTYALGRPLTFGDRSSVDQITADLRKQGDGLATMVELIATSELFHSK